MKSIVCLVVLLAVLPDSLWTASGEPNYSGTLAKLRNVLEEYKREEAIERLARLIKDDDEQVDRPSSLSDTSLLRRFLAGLENRGVDRHNVILKKFAVVIAGRPDVERDLTGDLSNLKNNPITIKAGTQYRIKISFRVENDFVTGLRYVQAMTRKGIKHPEYNYWVGAYVPMDELQSYSTPVLDAPIGLQWLGTYIVNSKFTGDNKNIYFEWQWAIDIERDW